MPEGPLFYFLFSFWIFFFSRVFLRFHRDISSSFSKNLQNFANSGNLATFLKKFANFGKILAIFRKNVILERCKGVHCVDLGESFPTHIFLQNLASIQPRTSTVKCARPSSRPAPRRDLPAENQPRRRQAFCQMMIDLDDSPPTGRESWLRASGSGWPGMCKGRSLV